MHSRSWCDGTLLGIFALDKLKVLHISTVRNYPKGIEKQLTFERSASRHLLDAQWDTVVFHCKKGAKGDFEHRLPPCFRGLLGSRLYTWLYLILVRKRYDFIVQRYLPFDPFQVVFGWFFKNRITVHHGKELEELVLVREGWRGKLAASLERWIGAVCRSQKKGVIGVTREIADYQVKEGRANAVVSVYPNGIDLGAVDVLPDYRTESINAAFVCGQFSRWHGLDKLLSQIKGESDKKLLSGIKLHLVGHLSDHNLREVEAINAQNEIIKVHGHLSGQDYRDVLAICDFGIGSLAMERQGLTEACTLKVREYLALGLPVFSGHRDTALFDGFEFYEIGSPNVRKLVEFGISMKTNTRAEVRECASGYIAKKSALEKVVKDLKMLKFDGEQA